MSLLRIGVNAPNLPKLRRPSGRERNPLHSSADVDEYNNRQLLRCVETRNRYQDQDREIPGPPGMRNSTTVTAVEVAMRTLPSVELAAYMAKEHGTQQHVNQLVDEIELAILKRSKQEHWRFYNKAGEPDSVRLLSSIVVEEWLNPAKYWRLRTDKDGNAIVRPITSAFARAMRCNRQTWYVTWRERFLVFQGYPERWIGS